MRGEEGWEGGGWEFQLSSIFFGMVDMEVRDRGGSGGEELPFGRLFF